MSKTPRQGVQPLKPLKPLTLDLFRRPFQRASRTLDLSCSFTFGKNDLQKDHGPEREPPS